MMAFAAEKAPSRQAAIKCLLVDDLEENLLALSALLKGDDVEILTARSGPEALELLLANDVALAFLDVQMPDMDGFELAELIRGSARTRHVPLIFVTAGARDQHRVFKGYETGAVDFLYKPIDPMILRNKADVFFELHRQRQQLRRELEERTEALRLNEMFMAVLSHDLRNPLGAILAGAHAMQTLATDDKLRDIAQRTASSGRRMSALIEDVLDVVRARLAGGIPIAPKPTDLGALADRVVTELRFSHPGRNIDILREGALEGRWDADRVAQVLSNLVGNALQHGTPERPVEVRLDGTDEGTLTIDVVNGGTIPEDLVPSLFDPFRGAQREGGRSDGLGLGLFIVKQVVEAHGGRVEVASANGETRFRVVLPREVPERG